MSSLEGDVRLSGSGPAVTLLSPLSPGNKAEAGVLAGRFALGACPARAVEQPRGLGSAHLSLWPPAVAEMGNGLKSGQEVAALPGTLSPPPPPPASLCLHLGAGWEGRGFSEGQPSYPFPLTSQMRRPARSRRAEEPRTESLPGHQTPDQTFA